MRWIVDLENKPNQRIVVRFDPKSEMVTFTGQYKPHNKEWVDFSEESYSMEIDLETIQDLLAKTYNKMKERLIAYNNIAEGFVLLKTIEIKEEDEE
jgi:hypothetical protein